MKHSVIAAALAAAIVLTPAVPAGAQAVGVTIGGRSVALNPAPIEQNGRVFVPLRGVFEQLGATVVYSNGQINATRGATTVSLRQIRRGSIRLLTRRPTHGLAASAAAAAGA